MIWTHHLVMVIEFHHDIRRMLSDVLRVSVNLHVVEDQGLVPGRVQCRLQLLCCLTDVEEGDVCIRVCDTGWNKCGGLTIKKDSIII